ncbi:MAG: hypothetical protein MPW16_14570 [Candidatus Manganitrophus sp.]|nr:MAG: hypothetical protein MPW16_14570 [Candidatus Manganitrophus sp.]
MILLKQILSGTNIGIFLSTLVHAGLGGGVYYTLTSAVEPSPRVVADLDLSMTSLIPAPPAPPPPPGTGAQAETTPAPVRTVAKKRAAASPLPADGDAAEAGSDHPAGRFGSLLRSSGGSGSA